MAGVINPSPYSSAAPKIPRIVNSHTARVAFARSRSGKARAISARMPPSPRLSARSTNAMYFTDTMSISAQKISESTPRTFSCDASTPVGPRKQLRKAYSGLVPMSP